MIKIERLEYELTDTKQAKEKQEDELYKRLSEERKKMTDEVSKRWKKWLGWDSNPRHRNDWCLKPAP